jgi:hypothetical protein
MDFHQFEVSYFGYSLGYIHKNWTNVFQYSGHSALAETIDAKVHPGANVIKLFLVS